ncbi:MAG TPA: hypothetical protein PKM41_06635 [Deltaproteobacteria bacterium]|nr:hypothetical protein [Deltaproteobacteria bacterium]HOI06786.1 hypothetical protein [Deltaproteobacteria bacterium]
MKRLVLVTVCLAVMGLAASTVSRAADPTINITGKWAMDVVTPKVTGVAVFTFQQNGEKLTGMYAGSLGEAPITGTIKGLDATWQFTTDPKKGPAIYTGKFDPSGKTVKGDIDFAGIMKGSFSGKKVK